MAKKYTYHYCATYSAAGNTQPPILPSTKNIRYSFGSVNGSIDGIATLSFEILTMEDYSKFKDLICDGFDDVDRESLCITSLSLLQKT